ncbi:MAG: hypothetical protein IJ530_15345 [Treponema sp.]|uniref:hypothetical protein n=1 Tax=Treponema sp. TaxID=166 RepID=UPI0025D2DC9E|nr:hypothetical protein [Treponema sp.]MBQ8681105.1 hypothetical protein [Treponema sp.]
MKQIFRIIPVIFLFLFVPLLFSCASGDGESASDLILKKTGNVWYKYNSESASKPTTADSQTLANIYIKYDTGNEKLILTAVGTNIYAKKENNLSSGKWVANITSLTLLGKVSKISSDPTSGKTKIESVQDWGDFAIEAIINALFE